MQFYEAQNAGTPLIKKLGIKAGFVMHTINVPEGYFARLGELPNGVERRKHLAGPLDFIHVFETSREELEERFPRLIRELGDDGMLWVSWPKATSGVESDIDREVVRAIGQNHGLVDVKVSAVDDTWSALKFVYRHGDDT